MVTPMIHPDAFCGSQWNTQRPLPNHPIFHFIWPTVDKLHQKNLQNYVLTPPPIIKRYTYIYQTSATRHMSIKTTSSTPTFFLIESETMTQQSYSPTPENLILPSMCTWHMSSTWYTPHLTQSPLTFKRTPQLQGLYPGALEVSVPVTSTWQVTSRRRLSHAHHWQLAASRTVQRHGNRRE